MASEHTGFKDSTGLTRWVRHLLYAQVAIAVASIVSNEMEYRLMTLNRVYVASDALDVVLALVTLALINGIYRAQMTHVNASS